MGAERPPRAPAFELSMAPSGEGSVTRWIGDLRSGGASSARLLWERYFDRLVHLARAKLRALLRGRGVRPESPTIDVADCGGLGPLRNETDEFLRRNAFSETRR